MALEMHRIVERRFDGTLQLRTGIDRGTVVAGVIGREKFAYDLWGRTVNLASRLESHGLPGRIRVSSEVGEAVRGRFVGQPRGRIRIKGVGEMETYFVDGPGG
jgi:adenylate cyclase